MNIEIGIGRMDLLLRSEMLFKGSNRVSGGMAMRETTLGRTGLRVKRLGFGGIPIQRVSEEEAIAIVERCYELGINYYDTARLYTVSEERIGKALEDVRERVILATKSANRSKEGVLGDLETSLKNLRTDYIDIYQLHAVSSIKAWRQVTSEGGALEALSEARDEGKIRHLGITSHDINLLSEIVRENIFETILVGYNYLTTEPERELLPLCKKLNVGTVIMKPLGGGALSNARTALKFVLANENVDVVVPGMGAVLEAEENASVVSSDYQLSQEEMDLIRQDNETLGNQYCRACDYCQPCPQEIPISFVLRAENQLLKLTGWTPTIEKQFRTAKLRVNTCLRCGQCESRCPYNLPIRELLPSKMDSLTKKRQEQGLPIIDN